jgi:hypothetical protein
MARRNTSELAFTAIRIEGGLLAADFLDRVAHLQAQEQSEPDYDIPKGLKLRDEIGRYWKIAQNLWQDFQTGRQRIDHDVHTFTVREFLVPLCRQVLGFSDLEQVGPISDGERVFPIGFQAKDGLVPLVFAAHAQTLEKSDPRFGDGVRRRSAFLLAQEYLNAHDTALWAIVSNGLKLRILRDNPSLTRPAYIEVDLEALFNEDLYPDFTAFWLLAHATRFGRAGGESKPDDCPLERWRNGSQEAGIRARDRLRVGVTEALRALGSGFLAHPQNQVLRDRLNQGELTPQTLYEQLLRLIYRLIFLATVEDRTAESGIRLVFAPGATREAMQLYERGYSLTRLRELAAKRRHYDRHSDLWQALTIAFESLAKGQPALGLPALGGLFGHESCPDLDVAQIENRYLLNAIFSLCFFREGAALARVNYRDMESEELGSVYESLLELVPMVEVGARHFAFIGDDQSEGATKGNARKLTGSYYTPDSLVQELIKSALDPVIEQTLRDRPQHPTQALLNLTVCDPACGSGHFLLAAARRLAEVLAKFRASDGNPTRDDYRHALREVIGHCIYGVDKNPLAIELAKTALWLESYTPDRPLNFLDHHLRCGDALLGVLDPKILEEGIPEKAFDPLSGDDKDVAKRLKAENRAALKSLQKLKSADLFAQSDVRQAADILESLPDETLDHIEQKRARWQNQTLQARDTLAAKVADTYVAAFLMPKVEQNAPTIPLTGYFWTLSQGEQNDTESEAKLSEAARFCKTHQVFHWWLEFPHIFAPRSLGDGLGVRDGGFSVLLGNPPWERIKLQEEEFFASRSPLVAEAQHKAERAKRIQLLQEGMLLHTVYPEQERAQNLTPPNQAEMKLYEEFITARRSAEAASLYAHDSKRYPLTGVGDVNTYALFAETFSKLVAPNGRAGFIVPTGIATDDSTKAYFAAMSQSGMLSSILAFENEEFIFPAVHHAYRFCLFTLRGSALGGDPATLVFFARQPSQIHERSRQFNLTPKEFQLINPNTRTCPVFRSQADAELTKKIYLAAPVLIEEVRKNEQDEEISPERNPWGIRFMRMLDMATDSGLFRSEPADDRLVLYEAKMIHQFDHRWATYEENRTDSRDCTITEKSDPDYAPLPRYWVSEREVLARIANVPRGIANAWLAEDGKKLLTEVGLWLVGHMQVTVGDALFLTEAEKINLELARAALSAKTRFQKARSEAETFPIPAELLNELSVGRGLQDFFSILDVWMDILSPRWLMGWRDITGVEKIRTLIASVIPRAGVGHTMPLLLTSLGTTRHKAALLANLNSTSLDFVARQKVGGTHLTYGFLKQFPILPPNHYTDTVLEFIVPRVLELTYTTHDLKLWAEDLGYNGSPFPWDPDRRAILRAELDAYYAKLYGLTRDELRYILDPTDVMGPDYPSETFRVLKNNELREFGEYLTRRLMLEAWDNFNY